MLTRIFATSKSSNFLWVSGYLLSLYALKIFIQLPNTYTLWNGIVDFTFAIFLIFSVLLVDFIVRKNDLTKKNSFVILFYACFLGLMPFPELTPNYFLAHLLILLGFRRIISLQSKRAIKKKIFDASFWFTLASFLYVWNIGFILIVFLAVLLFASRDYRNWIIPFMGVLCCLLFLLVGNLVVRDSLPNFAAWIQAPRFNFKELLEPKLFAPAITLTLFTILGSSLYLISKSKLVFRARRVPLVLFYSLVIAYLIGLIGNKENLAPWVVLVFPLAAICGFVAQKHKKKYIVEVLLWTLVLLPWLTTFVL